MKAVLEDEGGSSMHVSDMDWSADNFIAVFNAT